jgi:hypothetical protein
VAKRKQAALLETELRRLEEIKRLAIVAMFSDDELMERLVLKGGNALDLIYGISTRASLDVDFSMAEDFPEGDVPAYRARIERALEGTFRLSGYVVFDVVMEERPPEVTPELAKFWGGYRVEFKLIEKARFAQLSVDWAELRKQALSFGQGRKFIIDISRFEYVAGKEMRDFDGYRIFVYTPAMLVCEKLRAICQQLPEYGPVVRRARSGAPRARDFIDIHSLVTAGNVDMTTAENVALLRTVFAAKRVPMELLGLIRMYRDLHEHDFPAVRDTVKAGVDLREFAFYFDFVVDLTERLEALWNV